MDLFNKNIAPCCVYCTRSRNLGENEPMLCSKVGVVSPEYGCKNFKYDPLKRVPAKVGGFSQFSDEDFSLDIKENNVDFLEKLDKAIPE